MVDWARACERLERDLSTTLILNPRDDAPFAALAEQLVSEGVGTAAELQQRLQAAYPKAVVRARELTGEPFTIWYVYRDGHWISGPVGAPEGG